MLDRDLASLYETETRTLKQAVKRNIDRFPVDFMFELSNDDVDELVSQSVIPSKSYFGGANPLAFTEQGVSMLASVVRTPIAVDISLQLIRAFVEMRRFISTNAGIFQRLDKVEQKLIQSDENFNKLFNALEHKSIKPNQDIFFKGQIYDAYSFVSDLIRTAKTSIILIDNYIDDTVLTHFTKRKKDVSFTILTKTISKQLSLDIKKHNEQYPTIEVKIIKDTHDRFLIIDEKEIYHFGASLKDLGKKWFAFSKMDISSVKVLDKLKEEGLI
ncbi:MAG: ORF6N domain-containing protein [Bacteroidales bacterium]|nr:ORF6N domain-containing protein [Bacteroidales bacterium]